MNAARNGKVVKWDGRSILSGMSPLQKTLLAEKYDLNMKRKVYY